MQDSVDTGENLIVRCCNGHGEFGRQPCERVKDSGGSRRPNPHRVTSVQFQGSACIPTVFAVRGPSGAFVGLDVDENPNAGRCHGRVIVIEVAVQLGIG